jgi:hypothetical protein
MKYLTERENRLMNEIRFYFKTKTLYRSDSCDLTKKYGQLDRIFNASPSRRSCENGQCKKWTGQRRQNYFSNKKKIEEIRNTKLQEKIELQRFTEDLKAKEITPMNRRQPIKVTDEEYVWDIVNRKPGTLEPYYPYQIENDQVMTRKLEILIAGTGLSFPGSDCFGPIPKSPHIPCKFSA